ncbi:MAG: hypothetical protein GF418_16405 [Chitinivibrionales bacterium]|nr:hypothetical protein [Chitinivibrionales bacterium]MBD3397204.1 hypothetical protein [Chitinivibrionales bacterium]
MILSVIVMSMPVCGDGLPGEYLVTQRWRDLLSGCSPVNNPALMTEENYVSVRGAISPTLHGAFTLWELGFTVPLGLYQSAGLTWVGENDDDITRPAFDSQGRMIPTETAAADNQNNFFLLSYAINPWNRLSVGANVNISYQTNFGDPKTGFGVDLGMTYRLLRHPLLGDHLAGISVQNLYSTDTLPPTSTENNAHQYSRNLKLSWLANFWERRIETGIDFDIKDLGAQADEFATASFGEGTPEIEYDFNYRIGAWILRIIKAYFQIGSGYWGLAGGVNAPTINNGRDFTAMYQYMMLTRGEDASTHTWYVKVDVGKHREEVYARKMARLANILPNELYNKALKLYYDGKYWEAFFVFGQILAQFPDFFKNDLVNFYRGSCLEEMDMRAEALETYERMKEEYARSTAIPLADLGIMRIMYLNDDHDRVERQFKLLSTDAVVDSIKYHAFYLMGETRMKLDEHKKAIQLFSLVPETHPEYVFAQHSKAVAHIINLDLEQAMRSLENCLQARIETKEQQEVAHRSALLLGYLFYEENSLSKAVTALRMVAKDSYYYEDALLGLMWCGLKARQWSDCITAGKELQRVSDKPIVQYEGALLEAYAYIMQKNYEQAYTTLKPVSQKLATLEPPSEDSLAGRRQEYQRDRISYDHLAQQATQYSLQDPSSLVLSKSDSLHAEQVEMIKELHAYDKYVDEFARRTFFSRNIAMVRDDADYALAVIEKLRTRREEAKVGEKLMEKTEDLDEEMEKLQKELEELDDKGEAEQEKNEE